MDYCEINGTVFDVDVSISDYEEWFEVLDGENSGRAQAGNMIRDPLALYLGHKISFTRRGNDYASYDALWTFLKAHALDDSVSLKAADNQTSITQDVYYTAGKRKLESVINGIKLWGSLDVSFVPINSHEEAS